MVRGKIKMFDHWKCDRYEIIDANGNTTLEEVPHDGNGFAHEVRAVAASIANGEVQSDLMSWQHSLELTGLVENTEKLISKS